MNYIEPQDNQALPHEIRQILLALETGKELQGLDKYHNFIRGNFNGMEQASEAYGQSIITDATQVDASVVDQRNRKRVNERTNLEDCQRHEAADGSITDLGRANDPSYPAKEDALPGRIDTDGQSTQAAIERASLAPHRTLTPAEQNTTDPQQCEFSGNFFFF